MPIVAADLEAWASVSTPEDDSTTSGGIIQDDAHASGGVKVVFADLSDADTIEVLSDGTDTRNITIYGRLASGVIDSEVVALNGTTPVATTKTFKNFLKAVLASKDASRTVTVRKATGDTEICTLGPNVIACRRLFYDASVPSSGSTVRYELIYLKNSHATLALLAAKAKLSADPSAKVKIALAVATGNTPSVANRVTAPTGGNLEASGFVDDNVDINVPGTNLAAGAYIGCWLEFTLASGTAAIESSWTVNLFGNTAA